jgi:hypothetical protein
VLDWNPDRKLTKPFRDQDILVNIMKMMEARSVADLVRMAEALGVKPAALQH